MGQDTGHRKRARVPQTIVSKANIIIELHPIPHLTPFSFPLSTKTELHYHLSDLAATCTRDMTAKAEPLSCAVCLGTFSRQSHLRRHQLCRMHTLKRSQGTVSLLTIFPPDAAERQQKCNFCERTFKRRYAQACMARPVIA